MHKLILSILMGPLTIAPMVSSAKPPITCPPALEYTCVADSSCPVSRCTLTSKADSAWIFLAPYRPLKTTERTSCSNLQPGTYHPKYMASLYGPAKTLGYVAYCMYGEITPEAFAISAFCSSEYKKGKGAWQKGDETSPTYVCASASTCEFDPLLSK